MSASEMVRGYTPALAGLPQTPVSEDILKAHRSQKSWRDINTFWKTKQILYFLSIF